MKTIITTIILILTLNLISQNLYDNESNKLEKSSYVFYVHGLGNFNPENLLKVKNIMRSNFGVECVIEDSYPIYDYELTNEGHIDINRIGVLNKNGNHIFITTKKLRKDGLKVVGFRRNTNMIISDIDVTQTTILHEFAHILGLSHCEDTNCIMYFKETGSTDFCYSCKKMLISLQN